MDSDPEQICTEQWKAVLRIRCFYPGFEFSRSRIQGQKVSRIRI
jgi:hypothetical protein